MAQNKKLSSLIKITKGKKVIFGDTGKHSYIDIKCLRDDNVNGYTDEEGVFCTKKDIVIAWDGSKSGTVGYGLEGVIGSTLAKLEIIDNEVDTKYLGEFLRSNYKYLNGNVSGVAIPHLKKEFLVNLEIPLSDLDTQRLIVSEIEKQFSRLDEGLSSLLRIRENLKSYRASLLKSAVEGRLTAEWRAEYPDIESADILLDRIRTARREKWMEENPGKKYKEPERVKEGIEGLIIPDEWGVVDYNTIAYYFRSGTTAVPKSDPTEYPILRSSSVRSGKIDYLDVKFLNKEDSANKDNFLKENDIVFTRLNGTINYVGNCALVKGYDNQFQYSDRLFCSKISIPEMSNFIEFVFQTPFVRRKIESLAKSTAGHKRISTGDILTQQIPLPPLLEQHRIVEILEERFSVIDSLESLVEANIKRAENLKQAILKKAFCGELVQDSEK